ncbi:MAG: hypothetical protein K0R57_2491 [Paenibacillaceae bacterium]|nr:hypothetical protein [Paenibacillaceae bacterium]
MKYKNASDVLPENLLKEVQKYAAGETLYFPKDKERKQWGESSGARAFFQQRNEEIRQKHAQKNSVERIAEEYCLSAETVRKIIFR